MLDKFNLLKPTTEEYPVAEVSASGDMG